MFHTTIRVLRRGKTALRSFRSAQTYQEAAASLRQQIRFYRAQRYSVRGSIALNEAVIDRQGREHFGRSR